MAQVRPPASYEPVRAAARLRLAEVGRPRRVGLGDDLALVFISRETVRGAVEETLRNERITDPEAIAAEAAAFDGLLPGAGEVAAMLVLEVADPAEVAERSARLAGVERAVSLEIDSQAVTGMPAGDLAAAGEPSPAHLLRFSVGEAAGALVADPGTAVTLVVDHPACRVSTRLSAETRAALAADLAAAEA